MKIFFYSILLTLVTLVSCAKPHCPEPEASQIPLTSNLSEGLIAYYLFNGNANDLSGNNNHGTVIGSILTTDRFGNPNNAYLFDGISSYISVPNSTSLQSPINQFTLSAWVNVTDLSVLHWILDKRINAMTAPFTSYSLYTTNTKLWKTSSCTSNSQNNTGNTTIAVGTWVSLISVYDGNKIYLYINGEFESSSDLTGNILYSTQPLYIGKSPNGFAFMKGKIDDIRIYNRVLNASEISEVYNEGL